MSDESKYIEGKIQEIEATLMNLKENNNKQNLINLANKKVLPECFCATNNILKKNLGKSLLSDCFIVLRLFTEPLEKFLCGVEQNKF